MSLWKNIKAILILPATVLVVVPAILTVFFGADTLHVFGKPAMYILVPAGILLSGCGLVAMIFTIRDMNQIGKGTLAPWDKKEKLVIVGLYRHVRNPMLTGVLSILIGEAMILASTPILFWFVSFALLNAIYTKTVEEKQLEKQFGEQYKEYRKNVPAWLPRLKPYSKEDSD